MTLLNNDVLVKERFALLPKSITNLLNSAIFDKTLSEIVKRHSLNQKQSAQLSNEVVLTILFFEPLYTLVQRIESAVEINKDQSGNIYSDLFENIFKQEESTFSDFSLFYKDNAEINALTDSLRETELGISTPSAAPTQEESRPPEPAATPDDDIEELEKTLESLPKIRTMAVDMQASQDQETAPSISQEDLLKGRQQ
jgi:hypothetical protein